MALSAITLSVSEQHVKDLAAFTLAGVPYLLWRTSEIGTSRLWWRVHSAADGAAVDMKRLVPVQAMAAVGRADGTTVLVVYTTSTTDGVLWAIIADAATGLTVGEPVWVGRGTRPALAALGGARAALVYKDSQTGAVHLRETYDGGLSWSAARPVLNNRVLADEDLSLAVFDGTHLSVGQVGLGGRSLVETGSASRTRPITAILVPAANQLAVVEAAVRTGQVADNLRGRAALDGAGNVLAASRARRGVDDAVGDLALYNAFPDAPALLSSAVLAAGAAPGGEIVRAPIGAPGAGVVIATLAGAEVVADLAVFAGHALFAGYAETALTGRAGWVNLTNLTTGEFGLGAGVTRVGAVAAGVAAAGGFDLLAAGYTATGLEWLKLGAWVTPPSGVVLSETHRMPGRVNALGVVVTSGTSGRIYVGMPDRLNVYAFDGFGKPIRLLRSHPLLTGGEVHQIVALDSENVVAALGTAGVAVFGPGGEMLGHAAPSTIAAMPWAPSTVYGLNAQVRPTNQHPYAPQRRYFTCSRAGTSGTVEPAWGPTGTTNDPNAGGAGWTEVGPVDPVITGVAIDQALGRVFAVGLLGGPTATAGRIYALDAVGLINAPPRVPTPTFNVVEGAIHTSITQVLISSPLPAADIFYTLDGSAPGPDATPYVQGTTILFDLTGGYTIRAIALAIGFLPSRRADLHFSIDLPDLPPVLAGPNAGSYFMETFNVALSCAELGVAIRYTLDGSNPTPASTLYVIAIPVLESLTIKARAFKYGFDDSPIAVHAYSIVFPLVPVDPASTSHFLVFDGTLGDLNGSLAWSEVGVVPVVPLATVITGRPPAEGLGPLGAAGYYQLAGSSEPTPDVFDTLFVGDFVATFVLKSGVNGNDIFNNWPGTSYGLAFQHGGAGGVQVYNPAVGPVGAAAPTILDGGIHVVTFARKGTSWYWKLDKQAATTGTSAWPTYLATNVVRIGFSGYSGVGFAGVIYEARFVPKTIAGTADLDALHAAIIP